MCFSGLNASPPLLLAAIFLSRSIARPATRPLIDVSALTLVGPLLAVGMPTQNIFTLVLRLLCKLCAPPKAAGVAGHTCIRRRHHHHTYFTL